MPISQVRDAVAGGMWGLLVGDAVGVPFEFQTGLGPGAIEMPPPPGFHRSHSDAPPQAWSDDGAQALCLLASLLDCGRLDLDDLGRRLLRWGFEGYLAVDGVVFDVGTQTRTALARLRNGVPAEQAGRAEESGNGNGSLMRVLPLALWHQGSDVDLVSDAARQSLVTHGHVRSQVCCALYCLWIRGVLHGAGDPWDSAVRVVRETASSLPGWTAELDHHIRPETAPAGSGSGYVVDCLHSARLAAQEATFERAIRKAVSLGPDTDTTAAVTGGVAGVRHGLRGVPHRWLAALAGRSLAEPLVSRLIERW
ncbi:MAG TPA: ADP-ribosylglycohydrolase family protein [Gemmatimonadales bacterium]|nr:ADP-ribosylglycohydrolase family protein [Gemmatimonadales bacterium]